MSITETNAKIPNKKKTPKKEKPAYSALDKDNIKSRRATLSRHNDFVEDLQVVHGNTFFEDLEPNVSARPGFRRSDYDSFRPHEAIPIKFPDIIIACQHIYRTTGIVKTMIDLMTDFACDGMGFLHKTKSQEDFYNAWSRKINLQKTVNDFVLKLLRDGNVIVRRHTARLNKGAEKEMFKTLGKQPDIKLRKGDEPKVLRNEIPWQYMFISPAMVTSVGGPLSSFINQKFYALAIPRDVINLVKHPKEHQKALINKLPKDILAAIKNGKKTVLLPPDKIYVGFYKKDDWDEWATPILYPILKDLLFKNKMQLADLAALDGTINVIRLWKLGDHKEGILPNKAAANKLFTLLQPSVGGGSIDLIWDSMINMEAHYPPLEKILGSEKYERVDRDILFGLGIPEVLLGGKGSNFSNAFIQFKTLIERLEYIRSEVLTWLRQEIKLIMKAKGWKIPPKVVFNRLNLQDDNVIKQLLIQLYDRNVISIDNLQQAFETDFTIELERLRREDKIREQNPGLIDRIGPFVVEPSDDNPEDNGRPPNTPDKTDRKRQNIKPRDSAELLFIADELQNNIDNEISQLYLQSVGVKNIKCLKAKQKKELEDTKTYAFFNCDGNFNDIKELFSEKSENYKTIIGEYNRRVKAFIGYNGFEPKIADRKKIKSLAWISVR